MEKRIIIAFALSLLILIGYPYYLKTVYPPKDIAPAQESEIAQEPTLMKEENALLDSAASISQAPEHIQTPKVPEKEITITTPLSEITFSNYDATIKSIKLFDYLDKEGNPVELVPDVPSSQKPLFIDIASYPVVYTHFKDTYQVRFKADTDTLSITKTFTIDPDSYLINVDLVLENRSLKDVSLSHGYNMRVNTVFPGDGYQAQAYMYASQLVDGKSVKTKFGKKGFRKIHAGNIFWAAVSSKYFSIILKPKDGAKSVEVNDYETASGERGITSTLKMPELLLRSDSVYEDNFLVYAGPKKYELLKKLGSEMDRVIDFGFIPPFSKLTINLLNFFHRIVRNYGFAIILLTILVRLVLYPLTYKSYKSMKEMQKIQPLVQELQAKYKEEPKRMQKEMMLLYKEHKVNPLSGCLPMLFQMPVLIALFSTLRVAIELRGAPFILWITDLSEPDTLFTLPNGFAIHLLPLIMASTFFVQQKFSSVPASTPQQQQQQKMMGTFMPIFMGFIFYKMPSGLVLYFSLSTIIGIFDQYRIRKSK